MSDITTADTGGGGTLSLASGCAYVFSTVNNYWYGPNALPPISSAITIEGNGATIGRAGNSSSAFRLFFVAPDPTAAPTAGFVSPATGPASLTLEDLSVTGGLAQGGASDRGGGGAGMGGAIFSMGSLRLDRVTLSGNSAVGGGTGSGSGSLAGGGLGQSASGNTGGGFGGVVTGAQGTSTGGAKGGGAGFKVSESGSAPTNPCASAAGCGPDTGFGGAGVGAGPGDGSGGSASGTAPGGAFGQGGVGAGGGGVGGGGGFGDNFSLGSGGGFGGGGGLAASGGFGGGSGSAGNGVPVAGFGGGAGSPIGDFGGGGAGMGGAVFDLFGHVTETNSTFSGNDAVGGTASGGDASNAGQGLGGAIFSVDGSVSVVNATLAGNVASTAGGAIFNLGYGANEPSGTAASLSVKDSILSGSTTGTGSVVSDLVSDQPSAIEDGQPSTVPAAAVLQDANIIGFSQAQGTTIGGPPAVNANPRLGPLANNGGPGMLTMMPTAFSPALWAGSCNVSVDERGVPRPSGECDLGAVQAVGSPSITIATPAATSYLQGSTITAAYACSDSPGGPGLEAGAAGCAGTVANGVAIDTSTIGQHTFTVTATSYDGFANTQHVAYSVAAAQPSPAPTADESTTSIRFSGIQPQGTASASQPLTVTNNGTAPLVVSGIVLGGANPADYLVESDCQQPVAPAASCRINVRFDPQAPGASAATMTLLTNTTPPPQAVSLSGTGGGLPQGPPGLRGPRGPAGKIELVTCKPAVKATHHHRRTTTKCKARLVSGTVKFTTTRARVRATVSRRGVIYATGISIETNFGRMLVLTVRHHLTPGRYALALRAWRADHWTVDRTTIALR